MCFATYRATDIWGGEDSRSLDTIVMGVRKNLARLEKNQCIEDHTA